VPTQEDAEDVVQEAFLSAMKAIGSFDPSRPFGPWITRIVVNQGITFRRSRARRQDESMPGDVPSAGPSPAQVTERNEITGGSAPRSAVARAAAAHGAAVQLDGLSVEILKLAG
jgi:RNA polymerase sigma factor (sigma-70 family)